MSNHMDKYCIEGEDAKAQTDTHTHKKTKKHTNKCHSEN